MIDPMRVQERLHAVRRRISDAGGVDGVEILAVTKGFGPDAIDAAAAVGLRRIGENYAQELVSKRDAVERYPDLEVRFIGQLQSNKVRLLTGLADVVESVDRPSVVDALARRMPGVRILIQVNTGSAAGEIAPKGGCEVDGIEQLVERARTAGLQVEGLMTIGPTGSPPEEARPGFRLVRRLVDDLGLRECSMGMSDDLEVAVSEGSTQVRVGTALFGPRTGRTGR